MKIKKLDSEIRHDIVFSSETMVDITRQEDFLDELLVAREGLFDVGLNQGVSEHKRFMEKLRPLQ